MRLSRKWEQAVSEIERALTRLDRAASVDVVEPDRISLPKAIPSVSSSSKAAMYFDEKNGKLMVWSAARGDWLSFTAD